MKVVQRQIGGPVFRRWSSAALTSFFLVCAATGFSALAQTPTSAAPKPLIVATAPAVAPSLPANRPSIGLALGGGGALAMSEIGVIEWFEDHHIPVDVVAGTSMGCVLGALYASGDTVDQLKAVMNDQVFNSVFTLGPSYNALNYRRREDSRELPTDITVGLRHGVSLRNSVLIDHGLNAYLDRLFLRYGDRIEFNSLPIPLRCVATDLTDASSVTFARGSLPDAVRASVSIPGVYSPYVIDGHEFVDGAVLRNLPTQVVHEMKADVVLAVSLPLTPADEKDFGSILGVLQRSFAVAIEANERLSRRLATMVIEPNVNGFSSSDYLKTKALAARGYEAAESHKADLLKYALGDRQWIAYTAERAAKIPGPAGDVLHVDVKAPSAEIERAVQQSFQSIVNRPMDSKAIDALLDQIRSDGRYDADYNLGYETTPHRGASVDLTRPVVAVAVTDKKYGPPFLHLGVNIEAQAGGVTRAAFEGILLNQDLGGYGSELRTTFKVGFLTELSSEYYRHLASWGRASGGLFVAPKLILLREPFYIFENQTQIAQRQLQHAGGGVDLGWSDQRTQEFRAGWEMAAEHWQTQVGSDGQPNIYGSMQRARIRYVFDNRDSALIPRGGLRIASEAGYLFDAVASPNTPQLTTRAESLTRDSCGRNTSSS